jgi:hypothetical protein
LLRTSYEMCEQPELLGEAGPLASFPRELRSYGTMTSRKETVSGNGQGMTSNETRS